MARIENSDYDKLLKTINAMQELVAEAEEADEANANRKFVLYRGQCKEMVDEFVDMRDSMSIGPDGESTPILWELFRMACAAKTVLESCRGDDQTSWLQAALIQNDRIVFENIQADLNWGFKIFLEAGNLERTRCFRDRQPLSNNLANSDLNHLKKELQRLTTDENINTVPELDRKIATFLQTRLTNEEESLYFAESVVSNEPWDPTKPDNNALGKEGSSGKVQTIRLFGTKFARKNFFSGPPYKDFENEISIMPKLKHPNVVRLISSCRKSPAIIMECAEMNLEEYLVKRRLKFDSQGGRWLHTPTDGKSPTSAALDPHEMLIAVDIMYQISSGMAYFHKKPHEVAHLDLKPSNILVNICKEDFRNDVHMKIEEVFKRYVHVKICDMGESKKGMKEKSLEKISNPRFGTTLWQAPETCKEGKFVSMKKADVYSFAIICWEILHGMEPRFEGVTMSEHRKEVIKGTRLVIDPHLGHPYLKELIQECWHSNPNRRPKFSDCSLALQSYRAKLLGSREPLIDFKAPPETLEDKIKRSFRILILHAVHLRLNPLKFCPSSSRDCIASPAI